MKNNNIVVQKKKIMFLGAGLEQVAAITYAKEQGYFVHPEEKERLEDIKNEYK